MDYLEEFQEKYRLDTAKLERSRKAKTVVITSLVAGFAFLLWTLILVTEGGPSLYNPTRNVLVPIAAAISLSLCFVVIRTEELYDKEEVANHYLASAIEAFREENNEVVESRLFDLRSELQGADYLPEKRKEAVIQYVEAVEDAQDEAVRDSFEKFFETITREILERDQNSLDDVIDSIQTNSNSQNSYVDILRSSIRTGVREVEVSFWTMFVIAFAVGVAVFVFVDEEGGMLVTTGLIATFKIYDQRQS